ncbi:MAG: LLM class flavin-dependent oxidoreductase [Thaumarchaeota archaeon]|nr:LLM class flavin-dependent oxidoreductase [Nitrososphaerota archaeon]
MSSISTCGVMLEPQHGMAMNQLVGTARLAEDLGFGYLFRSDHLLPTDGRRGMDSPECWTSLGAIAASTTKLKFGPMVSPVGFRNPALLARMACTLHSFSGGRLQLSMGAGWYEDEYSAHGYPFPPLRVRLSQFREALAIVKAMIRDGRADFDGEHFSAHTDCLPRPSGDLHLIIGGKTKSMVRLAAKEADEWNLLGSAPDAFVALKSVLEGASGGRDILISEMGPFLIGRNRSELEVSARKQIAKYGLDMSPDDLFRRLKARNAPCGSVDEFVEQVRSKLDAGIQRFYFQTLVPENTEMLRLLADTLKDGF